MVFSVTLLGYIPCFSAYTLTSVVPETGNGPLYCCLLRFVVSIGSESSVVYRITAPLVAQVIVTVLGEAASAPGSEVMTGAATVFSDFTEGEASVIDASAVGVPETVICVSLSRLTLMPLTAATA